MSKTAYRTVFISDTHLGRQSCQAERLLRFLKSIRCDRLYLVGDILDLWQLKSGWHWPDRHNQVIRRILKMARDQTHVIYILGNHDDIADNLIGTGFGDIEIRESAIHVTADGRHFLVTHGDELDLLLKRHRWLGLWASRLYNYFFIFQPIINRIGRWLNFKWSLAAKLKAKTDLTLARDYEQSMMNEAARQHLDGVICGHTHDPKIIRSNGVIYANDGDWVESCTALVEHGSGELELLRID